MDTSRLKTLEAPIDLSYLKGRFNPEEVLETLGLEVIHHDSHNEILCRCPFPENHSNGDSVPSFSYNDDLMVYNCFTCGGGTLASLIKTLNNFTSNDQIENWLIDFSDLSENTDRDLKNEVMKILNSNKEETMMEYPGSVLTQFRKLHPYLEERGISREVAIDMRIGYDEKHDGIVIPHFVAGKLVGWQTRHLKKDGDKFVCAHCLEHKKRVPKYNNTHNFPRGNTLYNYSQALEYLKSSSDRMIIVESPFTVLKLKSMGFNNCVATFGSWSREQIFSLCVCLNGVILWPDNDPAGYENVNRILDYAASWFPVSIAPVHPKPKGDAADLSKEEVAEYLNYTYSSLVFKRMKKLLTLKEVQNGF
jgi:DNA primase